MDLHLPRPLVFVILAGVVAQPFAWQARHPPITCLSSADTGWVGVDVNERGCSRDELALFDLRWRAGETWAKLETPGVHAITRREARAFLEDIFAIVGRRDETPTSADSRTRVCATLKWQCDGAPEQQLALSADRCSARRDGRCAFTRANAMRDLVDAAAER